MYITPTLNIILFFNFLGILLSVIAVAIIAHAASLLVGTLRNGILSMLWGITFIFFHFVWSIFQIYYHVVPELQSLFIVIGMILILLSAKKLFSIYKPVK